MTALFRFTAKEVCEILIQYAAIKHGLRFESGEWNMNTRFDGTGQISTITISKIDAPKESS